MAWYDTSDPSYLHIVHTVDGAVQTIERSGPYRHISGLEHALPLKLEAALEANPELVMDDLSHRIGNRSTSVAASEELAKVLNESLPSHSEAVIRGTDSLLVTTIDVMRHSIVKARILVDDAGNAMCANVNKGRVSTNYRRMDSHEETIARVSEMVRV